VNEGVVEKEVQDVLRADDILTRSYMNPQHRLPAHLFVAYFKTQRTGQAPHSPKNCLPGTGWVPSESAIVPVEVPGRGAIEVNRYVVAKGDNKSLVMYWYQSRDRVVASEYSAKFYVVADALRYNRTDTALVRVTVPIVENDVQAAQSAAEDFIRSFYTPLRKHFPA
jgi:EpsI family protein